MRTRQAVRCSTLNTERSNARRAVSAGRCAGMNIPVRSESTGTWVVSIKLQARGSLPIAAISGSYGRGEMFHVKRSRMRATP